jgi:dTDP-glucose 4,6-dehydratase
MMETLLVTGGSGFIGSNFILQELGRGDRIIINFDLLTYAAHPMNLTDIDQNPRYVFVRGDINDQERISQVLHEHRPQSVVNFAAESHVDRSITGPSDFIQTNILGTFHLLQAALRYWEGLPRPDRSAFRFLQISTDEVFGSLSPSDPPFSERSPFAPNSPYSASKASADHLVRAFHNTYGLPTLTTHCSNNYGPRQYPEKLIPLMILNGLTGTPLPVYGDGLQIRDWLYVDDHCNALFKVLTLGRPGETYSIGGHCEKANIDVVHTICTNLDELYPQSPHVPHASLIRFVEDRLGHDRRYAIDCSEIERTLEWKARETFETGIRKTIEWYVSRTDWLNAVRKPTAGA